MFVVRAFAANGTPIAAPKSQFQHLPIRIGRNPLNDFVLEFAVISGFHARIEEVDGTVSVRDLGSTNGIFLPDATDGRPVRIAANMSVALDSANLCFFVSPHFRLAVEVVDQEAPVRSALTCGTVLGNLSITSAPRAAPQLRPSEAKLTPAPVQPAAAGQSHARSQPPAIGSAVPPNAGNGHPAPVRLETNTFQMDMPTLALMGLRELAGSLIPQRPLESSGDVARFITKLHDAMEVFCRTFIPLRQGYSEFVASLDLQRAVNEPSAYASPSAQALTQARTPEAIALALLDPKDRSFDGPNAVEGILADLMLHQVAILDGVMEGVRSLLNELSPEAIEQATANGGAAGLLGTKYKARWEEFCQRFEKLSEGQQAFSYVFGQDFAEVYRQYWQRKAGGEAGGLRTERPPR